MQSIQWNESQHPREKDGKFAEKGSVGVPATPRESAEIKRQGDVDRQGNYKGTSIPAPRMKAIMSRHIRELLKIEREEREAGYGKGSHSNAWYMLQMETANEIRSQARRNQQKIEVKALSRKEKSLERQMDRLENAIDEMEETYADRDGGNADELVFPDKKAESLYKRRKAKLEKIRQEYDDVEEMIENAMESLGNEPYWLRPEEEMMRRMEKEQRMRDRREEERLSKYSPAMRALMRTPVRRNTPADQATDLQIKEWSEELYGADDPLKVSRLRK